MSSTSENSTRTVRIEVFNPASRRWSYAGSCLSSDGSVEGALQRALNQLGFASKARAVDQESGAILSFMEN